MLEPNAAAYIEVSFKGANDENIQSFKLDFKQFLLDVIEALDSIENGASSNYVTHEQLEEQLGNYVTIATEQKIVGKKSFTQLASFITGISTTDITATGTADLTAEHAKWS